MENEPKDSIKNTQEVQEGAFESVSGNEEGLSVKGVGEVAGGVPEGNEGKHPKKELVISLVILGILAVTAAVLIIWRPWENENDAATADEDVTIEQEKKETHGNSEESEEKEAIRIERTELRLDDEVVQRVFGDLFQGSGRYGVDSLGHLGLYMSWIGVDLTDFMMLQHFMYRDDMSRVCRGTQQEKNELLPVNLDDIVADRDSLQNCRYGEDLRNRVKALFGRTLTLADMPDRIGWWYYDKNNDEYIYQCRGTGEMVNMRRNEVVLYRAEVKDEKMNLYLAGAQLRSACEVGDRSGCDQNEWYVLPVAATFDFYDSNFRQNYGEYAVDGGSLDLNKDDYGNYADEFYEYVKDNKERLGDYKVIFVKNEEGNYIYQSVEKII